MATQSYTLRIPVELMAALNSLADGSSEGKAAIVIRALRREIECGGSSVVEQRASSPKVAGSIPAPRSKVGDASTKLKPGEAMPVIHDGGVSLYTVSRDKAPALAGISRKPRAGKLKIAGRDVVLDPALPPNRIELRGPERKTTQCPQCFSLNGMHQRWCKTKVS